jgi:hypothetical protein
MYSCIILIVQSQELASGRPRGTCRRTSNENGLIRHACDVDGFGCEGSWREKTTILYMQIKHGGFNSEATELKDEPNSSLSAETTTV